MTQFQGKVVLQQLNEGSKSEHPAVVLLTDNGPMKLRRPGGNPFNDAVLKKLVGHEITCVGQVHQSQLLMTHWDLVPGN
jgi:hypothetical protein